MKKRPGRRARWATRLTEAASPVFVIDGDRKVIFFNAGCETLTGWKADEVVGHVCDYRTEGEAGLESLTGSLCPPPEVFEGQRASVPAYVPNRQGQVLPRLVQFAPLADAEGSVDVVLGTIGPLEKTGSSPRISPAQQLHAELAALRQTLRQQFGVKSLIARSEPMQRVARQIRLAAGSMVPLFLQGEPGTGKEHVARAIHYESSVGRRSFVPLDCRRLTSHELKRGVRRAFDLPEDETGQQQSSKSSGTPVPALQPGTLYFAHLEAMPRDVQQRVVESFAEQGGDRPEIRLMASSSERLEPLLDDDRLRTDLYYLLTPLRIELPPLRQREDDLLPLAQWLLERSNRGEARQIGGFADGVLEQFRRYNWPGNVAELAAVIGECRQSATGTLIAEGDLPFRFRSGRDAQSVGPPVRRKPVPLEPLLAQVEKEQIEVALEESRYNKSQAAKLLGLTRTRLYRRMESLGIEDREGT